MDWITKTVFYHIYPLGFWTPAPTGNRSTGSAGGLDSSSQGAGVSCVSGAVFGVQRGTAMTPGLLSNRQAPGDSHLPHRMRPSARKAASAWCWDKVFNHVGREFWAFSGCTAKRPGSRCGWFPGHEESFGGGGSWAIPSGMTPGRAISTW